MAGRHFTEMTQTHQFITEPPKICSHYKTRCSKSIWSSILKHYRAELPQYITYEALKHPCWPFLQPGGTFLWSTDTITTEMADTTLPDLWAQLLQNGRRNVNISPPEHPLLYAGPCGNSHPLSLLGTHVPFTAETCARHPSDGRWLSDSGDTVSLLPDNHQPVLGSWHMYCPLQRNQVWLMIVRPAKKGGGGVGGGAELMIARQWQ